MTLSSIKKKGRTKKPCEFCLEDKGHKCGDCFKKLTAKQCRKMEGVCKDCDLMYGDS